MKKLICAAFIALLSTFTSITSAGVVKETRDFKGTLSVGKEFATLDTGDAKTDLSIQWLGLKTNKVDELIEKCSENKTCQVRASVYEGPDLSGDGVTYWLVEVFDVN